jgi:hypothetical protein
MKCLRCQHDNPPSRKFCGERGSQRAANLRFMRCGKPARAGERWNRADSGADEVNRSYWDVVHDARGLRIVNRP